MRQPLAPPRISAAFRQAILSSTLLVGTVALLLLLASQGFEILSASRAYVGGEGLWSKAQKDAVNHLLRYAYGREEGEFMRFRAALQIPLGDRTARLELERAAPDYDAVRRGFLQGRNHPDDVDRMALFSVASGA